MSSAEALSKRIDALGEALRAAGVEEDRIAAILATAAAASLHAVLLDAVLDGGAAPVRAARPEVRLLRTAAQ